MDHEKWLEQHDRMMADHNEWLVRHDQAMTRLEKLQEGTEKTLRWAIRLAVQDARRQRKWNQESAKDRAELRQALKAFLERGGNGKH